MRISKVLIKPHPFLRVFSWEGLYVSSSQKRSSPPQWNHWPLVKAVNNVFEVLYELLSRQMSGGNFPKQWWVQSLVWKVILNKNHHSRCGTYSRPCDRRLICRLCLINVSLLKCMSYNAAAKHQYTHTLSCCVPSSSSVHRLVKQ